MPTLPVFPNHYPYGRMMLEGKLAIDDCVVKTRSYTWDYRGPVLLYTSGRTAQQAVEAYDYPKGKHEHKTIIGVADLVDTRELTDEEGWVLVKGFNNLDDEKLKALRKKHPEEDAAFCVQHDMDHNLIAPFPIGFFFKKPKIFPKPISFSWPPGPVQRIMTKIKKGSELAEALKKAHVKI